MHWFSRMLHHRHPDPDHSAVMSDLNVKDQQIDGLLQTANALVLEMRTTVDRASTGLRGPGQEGGHGHG
jgi:hypothetical protein